MKQFKHHKDLIRYAVRRAIHRCDVEIPARMGMAMEDYQMRNPPDFLNQAKDKLRRVK